MRREEMADLTAFLVVAQERSFTRAAAKLGLSQSATSQIVRKLEERLGVRLLSRTTRNVAPTDAGDRLVETLGPMLRDLDRSLEELTALRDRPAGRVRITAVEHAAKTVLTPALAPLMRDYPEIAIELSVDYGLVDIVEKRFDAGVRLGEQVAKDMVALRISEDIPMAIVGSPDYFRRHPPPKAPRDLPDHRCLSLRLPSSESLYAWPLLDGGRTIRLRTDSPFIASTIDLLVDAALEGVGLAFVPLDQVAAHISEGRLVRTLTAATPVLPGYHLYYPSRRQSSPAFRLFIKALQARRAGTKPEGGQT